MTPAPTTPPRDARGSDPGELSPREPWPREPSRRRVLEGASLGAAGLLLPRRAGAEEPGRKDGQAPAEGAQKATGTDAGAPRPLAAGPGRARLKPEPAGETPVWCFDGRTEPPVLRIRHGESLRVRVENRTDKPLSLHWHGVRNVNAMDGVGGVTQPPIAPGESFLYAFTPPDAGTALIRPLVVGGASEPAGRGLSGLLVVEERDPPPVDRDLAFLLRDWRLEDDGAPLPFGQTAFAASSGRLGNLVTLNGRPIPDSVEVAPGSRLRLRLANACNARRTHVSFEGAKAYVVAVDGQPTDTFEPLRATLPFLPGTRYDLILDMPAQEGARVDLKALIGPGLVLATLVAKGEGKGEAKGEGKSGAKDAGKGEGKSEAKGQGNAQGGPRPPTGPIGNNPLLPPQLRLQNAVRRDVVLAGGASFDRGKPETDPVYTGDPARIWQINGVSGSPAAPPAFTVKRGQVVVLAVRNDTRFVQTLHLHGHVFRLLHPLDDGWEPYWLDTFQLFEGKTARIAFLADNPGRWLIASTVLERFDTGMWTSFEVT